MSEDEDPYTDPVEVPIEDALDLHPFAPQEIPSVVASYLAAAVDAGFREVRLIHGRGRGVQRRRVQAELARNALVEGFLHADRWRTSTISQRCGASRVRSSC